MNLAAQQALLDRLAAGPASAADIARALGLSRSAVSRLIQPLERSGRIIRTSATRGARYGLARALGAVGSSWPLYRIDASGRGGQVATVHAVERDSILVVGGPGRLRGLFPGLPYYLQDRRPAGFLGRAIPAAHPELALPARVVDWSDDHVLVFLTQRGSETTGDLVLGDAALDRHLGGLHRPAVVAQAERPQAYVDMAAAAMHGAPPGSSAHGEHPKFAVRIRRESGQVEHALVKFSPPRTGPVGVRWSDLLVAEHAATRVLSRHGLPAARTELLEHGDQVFLESVRFDREGDAGRRGVASLFSVDAALYGQLDSWHAAARRLKADALLSDDDAEQLAVLDTFGALIANTDRHFGNVTLFDDYTGQFRLAPVYDMLPMFFAPQDGHILERAFVPPGPTASTLVAWPRARDLAEEYWARLVEDARLSEDFRARAVAALGSVRTLT
jgi:biotin operon repressor